MPPPDLGGISIDEVCNTARDIVFKAKRTDTLSELTPRLIRREIETRLGLTDEILDNKTYRKAVKESTEQAINDDADDADQEARSSPEPTKTSAKKKAPAAQGRKRAVPEPKDEPASPPPKRKKARRAVIGSDEEVGSLVAADRMSAAARIASTLDGGSPMDIDDAAPKSAPGARDDEPRPAHSNTSTRAAKDRGAKKVPKSAAEVVVDDGVDSGVEKELTRTLAANSEPVVGAAAIAGQSSKPDDHDARSESEMSVLIDSTPIKKKRGRKGDAEGGPSIKSKAKSKAKEAPVKSARKGKAKEPTSKDEETIKRLKSIVNACGVRPRWAKEFGDSSTPIQQTKRLRQMLIDLGMEGRPSLEKAKTIKARRELADELEEVQAFEKKWVKEGDVDEVESHGKRAVAKRGGSTSSAAAADESGAEDNSDGEEKPVKSKRGERNTNTARRSIMAFLEDQSESD